MDHLQEEEKRKEDKKTSGEKELSSRSRIEIIQSLFQAFEQERQIKEEFQATDLGELTKKLLSDYNDVQTHALTQLCNFTRNEDTHQKLIENKILSPLCILLSKIPQMDLDRPDHELTARLICHTLARLSDEEKYTQHMVAEGIVPPLVQVILSLRKGLIRKYASRCIYHIGESAFLRESIPNALKNHPDEEQIRFIVDISQDPLDTEEKDYWDEMLQNTDLVRHQYKLGKAWYDPLDFLYVTKLLEDNFEMIKQEALAQCREDVMVPWPEKFLYKDGWNVLGMYAFQNKLEKPCQMCPKTNSILEQIPGLQTALFSTLKPRCHIKPHIGYYQYSEKILRVHMGIVVPTGCIIKVNGEERTWEEGKCIVFDDTFRHEVWNPSYQTTRIVLMLDIEFKGNVSDRNQEFYAKSAKQASEFGTSALISRDLIDALASFGADNNSQSFKERPEKYL